MKIDSCRAARGPVSACLIAGALALFAAVAPARAQNLVPNQEFDNGLAPWTQFLSSAPDPSGSGAAPAWAATPDVVSNPSSGSALIDIATAQPATDASSGIAQCFDFPGGPTSVSFVNYGMSFLVPTTTTDDGSLSATVEIRLFAGAGCSNFIGGGSQGQVIMPGQASDTTWYSLADTGFAPPGAPVMAASAEIRGYLRQTGTTPTQSDYQAYVDRFRLVLNSTLPVRLLQFDVE